MKRRVPELLPITGKDSQPVFAPTTTAVLTKDQLMDWLQIGDKRYLDELAVRHSGKSWDYDTAS